MAKLKTSRYDKIRKRLLQNSKVIIVTMKNLNQDKTIWQQNLKT